MRFLVYLSLCLYLAAPLSAWAQEALKSPLSYSLREYGVILGIALLGGLVRWYLAIKKGETTVYNLSALIGELAVSAFVGLLTFWICESLNVNPLLTAAAVGMSGHMGAKGLVWMERAGKRFAETKLGVILDETGNAPLGKK